MQDKKKLENFTKAKHELINMCSSLQSNPASDKLLRLASEARWYKASTDDERPSTLQILIKMQAELESLLALLVIENSKDEHAADALNKWEKKVQRQSRNSNQFSFNPDIQEYSETSEVIPDIMHASMITNVLITLCKADEIDPSAKEFRALKNARDELKHDVGYTADTMKQESLRIHRAIESCKDGESFTKLKDLIFYNRVETLSDRFLSGVEYNVTDIDRRWRLYSDVLTICNEEIIDSVISAMKKVSIRLKQLNENDGPSLS